MMALLGFSTIDYVVLVVYLLGLVLVGFYFQRGQKSTDEFFLASRSMGWLPVGVSLMATLLSGLSYAGFPSMGYEVGLLTLAIPVSVWCIFPIVHWYVLPLYRGLGLMTIYEYLELRFDVRTRLLSSLIFIVWRLLWLGGVLYVPCKMLTVAAGLDMPFWVLLVILGAVSTLYTFLGGMRAVIWTDVAQGVIMFGGVGIIIFSLFANIDGRAERVWEVASSFGRSEVINPKFDWQSPWSIWALLPHWGLALLSFYVADQITAQRF